MAKNRGSRGSLQSTSTFAKLESFTVFPLLGACVNVLEIKYKLSNKKNKTLLVCVFCVQFQSRLRCESTPSFPSQCELASVTVKFILCPEQGRTN